MLTYVQQMLGRPTLINKQRDQTGQLPEDALQTKGVMCRMDKDGHTRHAHNKQNLLASDVSASLFQRRRYKKGPALGES
jgi:hypothetical protein